MITSLAIYSRAFISLVLVSIFYFKIIIISCPKNERIPILNTTEPGTDCTINMLFYTEVAKHEQHQSLHCILEKKSCLLFFQLVLTITDIALKCYTTKLIMFVPYILFAELLLVGKLVY